MTPTALIVDADSKPWWQSKTLVINAIAAALIALEAGTGMLQPLLPVNVYTAIAVALPVINAVLRVITTQALVMRGSE
jgi:hypothetical protein